MFDPLTEFSLFQCVYQPTRFSSDGCSKSVLDLFATTWPDLVKSVSISDPISDHCLVVISAYMTLSAPVHNRSTKQRSPAVGDGLRTAGMQGTKDVNAA